MKRQSILVWVVVLTAGTSGSFHINFHVEAPDQTLTILNPNGKEHLLGGSTYAIRWWYPGNEGCGGNYLLDYSIDNGNNWIPVDSNPVSNTCSYDWLVPSIFSNQCLIRITDANDPNISDESDDSFHIYRCMSNVLGDWNGDCYIDFADFSIIAAGWNVPSGTDINDLATFVQYWLDCANPYDPSCCNFGEAMPEYPIDGALIEGDIVSGYIFTSLIFIPGATAVEHTGYFNEDYSKVESRAQDANLGPPPYGYIEGYEYTFWVGNPGVPPITDSLVRGTTYYWTVDETDALGNTFASDIWEFTIQDFKATLPNPPNEATFVETDVLLSWQPGYYVEDHDIYMGTSWEDVNNARYNPFNQPPEFVATVLEPNIAVTSLASNTTYYWRVDQVNGRRPPFWESTYYKGDVWCFTTISGSAEPDFPADGVVIKGDIVSGNISTHLKFIPGPTAVEHTGYFSDDYSKVESRAEDANLGSPPYGYIKGYEYTFWVGNPGVPPITDSLVRGTTYYWTVDETDALGNTLAGDIWEFTVRDFKATLPNPPNEATFVETDVLLSWQPGYGVYYYDIYIGTSWEDVNNAVYDYFNPPPEFVATTTERNILVTGLLDNTRYYWRVDEVERSPLFFPPYAFYKGDVWCFTTTSGSAEPDFPPDGEVIRGETVTYLGDNYIWTELIFIPGATAVEHAGYFSDNYSKVESRAEDANLGPPPYGDFAGYEYTFWVGNPYIPPANDTLVRGTKYYWTVDETDALGNTFAGDIWEFSIYGYYAFEPSPPNEAEDVETDVLLSWLPGFGACYHDVYIGTSWEDVNNAVYDSNNPPPEFLARISEPNIAVTGLELNTKYYWRVDGLSGRSCCGCDPSFPFFYCYVEAKGDVWCFTTAPSALNNDGSISFKDYAIPSNYRQKTGPITPGYVRKDDVFVYKD